MGNFQCRRTCLFYDRCSWQIVSTHPFGQLIRSIRDEQIIMQKWITNEESQSKDYQWRKQSQESFIPRVYDFGKNSEWISSTIHTGYFIITTPMLPISECRQLNTEQAVFLLKQVINGIKFLQNKYGYFGFKSNMVYISSFGRPIVWINSNLASNKPKIPNKNLEYRQQQLITEIFSAISKKLSARCQLPINPKNKNIQQIIKQLKEYLYIIDSNMIIIQQAGHKNYLEYKQKNKQKNKQNNSKKSMKSSKLIENQMKKSNLEQEDSNYQSKLSISTAFKKNKQDINIKKSLTTEEKDPDEMLEDLIRTEGIIIGDE